MSVELFERPTPHWLIGLLKRARTEEDNRFLLGCAVQESTVQTNWVNTPWKR